MKIADVIVLERKRPLRDVSALARSIQEVGLMQPIVVTQDRVLIAGLHRLEACRLLGWTEIAHRTVKADDLRRELGEIDENLVRNELTVLERAQHLKRRKEIYEALHPDAMTFSQEKQRQRATGTPSETISPGFAIDTSSKTGLTARTVQHEVQIATRIAPEVQARLAPTPVADNKTELLKIARIKDPTEQRRVADKIAAGEAESVNEVKLLDKRALAEEIRANPVITPDGRYQVIAIDPPWKYDSRAEDTTHRGKNLYPDMTVEQIYAVPVPAKSQDDCVLWLWTTNAFMRDAFTCLDAWGFREKTILTWDKEILGLGDWLRNVTEHCIVAVRGRPIVSLTNQTTIIREKRREHSRKPEAFYSLVEALCPGSKLEMFAREKRPGWDSWGAEPEKFNAA